jgi:hypothetical protein
MGYCLRLCRGRWTLRCFIFPINFKMPGAFGMRASSQYYFKEKLAWNYLVAFVFLGVAAFFAFAFKAPTPPA